MLSALLLLAPALGLAAPVHKFQTRDTNMQNFVSAMLQISTNNRLWGVQQLGPSYDVGKDVDPDTSRVRTRKLMADLNTVCNATYANEQTDCKAISAFASAAVFAYDRDMTGADMFAALGSERVNNMNTAISSFCAHNVVYNGLGCTYLGNGYNYFAGQSAGVNAGPYTDQFSQCAVLDMVDGASSGMTRRSILDENLLNLVSFAPGSKGAIGAGEAGESRIANISPGGLGTGDSVGPAQVSNMLGLVQRSGLHLDANVDAALNLDTRSYHSDGLNVDLEANVDLNLNERDIQTGSMAPAGPGAATHIKVPSTHNIKVGVDQRRSRQDKRTTYTTGDFTSTIDNDGNGSYTFTETSPVVNLTTQAAPGGASFNIQLPDSLLDNGSQAGQDALKGLGYRSLSGVASSGSTGTQMGDVYSPAGSAPADVAATIKALQSRSDMEARQGNLLDGLPVVGSLLGGALKREVDERQGNLLDGLPVVGSLLGGALKREDLDERQGNLLDGLPVVGSLLGGALKREDLDERQGNLLGGLPVVGDLLGGALKKRAYSPMAQGENRKRHSRSRARRQAA